MTPVPIPLTRGRWLSSGENGQRLVEAAFFSLEMLTTQGWTFCTASTTGPRRDPARQRVGADHADAARSHSARVKTPFRRVQCVDTVMVPPACSCGLGRRRRTVAA